jgi:hypothetical protein
MLRLFVVCLSIANLCYARVWEELLGIQPDQLFWESHPPYRFQYIAAIADVLILATVFFLVTLALRRAPAWLRSIWLMVLILLSANAMRMIISSSFKALRDPSPTPLRLVAFFLTAAGLLATCWLVFYSNATAGRLGAFVATLFLPFVLYTFGKSILKTARYNDQGMANKPTLARIAKVPDRRVVWIIFDEMDYRLSFDSQPAQNQLPNFDRLRSQSLTAANALPPGILTAAAMPALIYGSDIRTTDPLSPDRMRLNLADGGKLFFGDRPNVFSNARAAGFNTAIVGWYLPYCKSLSSSLTDCWWNPRQSQENSVGNTFAQVLMLQSRSLLETHSFSVFGQSLTTRGHAAMYTALLAHAKQAAVESGLGLVLLHFNIPHLPTFYDRRTGGFDRTNPTGGYSDGLVLADHTMGELRAEMERKGVWDHTIVVVSADHFYRNSPLVNGRRDPRVPFIVHYPGDDHRVDYDSEFRTVLTSDLILASLRGEVRSNAEAASFMSQDLARNSWARAFDVSVNATSAIIGN